MGETATEAREERLRRWAREHRGILFKVSRAYAGNAEEEEDLRQEILLQLWRSLPSFDGDRARRR